MMGGGVQNLLSRIGDFADTISLGTAGRVFLAWSESVNKKNRAAQLSRAEICRRFTIIGTQYTRTAAALDRAPRAELERMAQELRASMTAPESERLRH
jgi:hypothetical protein